MSTLPKLPDPPSVDECVAEIRALAPRAVAAVARSRKVAEEAADEDRAMAAAELSDAFLDLGAAEDRLRFAVYAQWGGPPPIDQIRRR